MIRALRGSFTPMAESAGTWNGTAYIPLDKPKSRKRNPATGRWMSIRYRVLVMQNGPRLTLTIAAFYRKKNRSLSQIQTLRYILSSKFVPRWRTNLPQVKDCRQYFVLSNSGGQRGRREGRAV